MNAIPVPVPAAAGNNNDMNLGKEFSEVVYNVLWFVMEQKTNHFHKHGTTPPSSEHLRDYTGIYADLIYGYIEPEGWKKLCDTISIRKLALSNKSLFEYVFRHLQDIGANKSTGGNDWWHSSAYVEITKEMKKTVPRALYENIPKKEDGKLARHIYWTDWYPYIYRKFEKLGFWKAFPTWDSGTGDIDKDLYDSTRTGRGPRPDIWPLIEIRNDIMKLREKFGCSSGFDVEIAITSFFKSGSFGPRKIDV